MEEVTLEQVLARGNVAVFLDIAVGGHAIGRVKFELFKTQVPRAAENFRQFCTVRACSRAACALRARA